MKHRIIAIAICFWHFCIGYAGCFLGCLLAGLRMMSLARMLLVMFTRPAENLSPKER